MALLFYSTNYNPDRARAEIQKLLLQMGARRISYEFSGAVGQTHVTGISFTLATVHGEQEYLLPAREEKVRRVLERQGVLRGAKRSFDREMQRSHAESVAWRTLLEWLKVQAALIETEQAESSEVMLPYMLVQAEGGQRVTVYEQFTSAPALPSGAPA